MKKRTFFAKVGLIVSAAVIAIMAPAMVLATNWSPERPTKVYSPGVAGFDHVTFNSFTNVPSFGDERGFFLAKDAANPNAGGWTDQIQVKPGQEILLQAYVHNGADSSLNDAPGQPGIARNTKVKMYIPTATAPGLRSNAYISASNANPGEVTDTADITSADGTPVSLSYVAGSARAFTNAVPTGMPISDNIVGDGALIGYQQPDGNVPACFQYTALVTIRVKVNAPSLSLTKQIAHPGQAWTKEVDSAPGETLSYLLTYQNKGTAVAHHVTVRDQMPPHADFVPGSARIYTDSTGPEGEQLSDTALFTTGGIDTSDYAPGAGGYIKFQVKLKNDFAPGHTRVQNVAYAHDTEMPNEIFDMAWFNVNNNEQPTELICKSLSVTLAPTDGTLPNKPTFTGVAEKSGPGQLTPKTYEYKVFKVDGDSVVPMPGSPVVDQNTALTDTKAQAFTFNEAGKYSVALTITDSNGKQVTGPDCAKQFTLTSTPPPTPPTPVTPVTPVTPQPQNLPSTGVESGAAGLLGMTGLTFGTLKYRKSKKAVSEALRNIAKR